ncbi:MAG: HEAT repeat domain-containing protein [Planctomycetota bacterium]
MPTLPKSLTDKESTKLVRATNRNIQNWHDLMFVQGSTLAGQALRKNIQETVDDNFETFSQVALTPDHDYKPLAIMAVRGIAFSFKHRDEGRDILLSLLQNESPTMIANAALGLGMLKSKKTSEIDLATLITLLEHRNRGVRTNAADALGELFRIKQTPRELTSMYREAIDRLTVIGQDRDNVFGRRAASAALGNLHHPASFDALVEMLDDTDIQVQIGVLDALRKLKDPRALEYVLDYLDDNSTGPGGSHAQKTLEDICISAGLMKDARDATDLGTSARRWRQYIDAARMEGG